MKKILPILAILFALGCGNEKENLSKTINELNNSDSLESTENIARLNQALRTYIDKYPKDEHTPDYTYLAAQTCNGLNEHRMALDYFDKFRNEYPDEKRTADATFIMGFIYANHLQQPDSASLYYQEMIVKYPDHQLTPAAQAEIRNLGKSAEQIYNEFRNTDTTGLSDSTNPID